jgi:hypothetical protein
MPDFLVKLVAPNDSHMRQLRFAISGTTGNVKEGDGGGYQTAANDAIAQQKLEAALMQFHSQLARLTAWRSFGAGNGELLDLDEMIRTSAPGSLPPIQAPVPAQPAPKLVPTPGLTPGEMVPRYNPDGSIFAYEGVDEDGKTFAYQVKRIKPANIRIVDWPAKPIAFRDQPGNAYDLIRLRKTTNDERLKIDLRKPGPHRVIVRMGDMAAGTGRHYRVQYDPTQPADQRYGTMTTDASGGLTVVARSSGYEAAVWAIGVYERAQRTGWEQWVEKQYGAAINPNGPTTSIETDPRTLQPVGTPSPLQALLPVHPQSDVNLGDPTHEPTIRPPTDPNAAPLTPPSPQFPMSATPPAQQLRDTPKTKPAEDQEPAIKPDPLATEIAMLKGRNRALEEQIEQMAKQVEIPGPGVAAELARSRSDLKLLRSGLESLVGASPTAGIHDLASQVFFRLREQTNELAAWRQIRETFPADLTDAEVIEAAVWAVDAARKAKEVPPVEGKRTGSRRKRAEPSALPDPLPLPTPEEEVGVLPSVEGA